jgi:hypothetical protein
MSQKEIEASAQVKSEGTQTQGRANGPMGYLVQRCASCGRTMMLGEGDTLFGDKWFHGVCWALEATGNR